MHGLTKLDAGLLALGVAVMDEWDRLPEGGEIRIGKIEGKPAGDGWISRAIAEVQHLESTGIGEEEL